MTEMESLRAIAARQHGLFTRGQARQAGIGRKMLQRRVQAGYVTYVTPRVLRIGGADVSPWQDPMAAVLDVGLDAVVSHLTAARLWGVPNLPTAPTDVSIERISRRNEAAVRVHHLTLIPPDQRAWVHDIPATAPPLTVLLVAGVYGAHRAAQVLDHFLGAGDTTLDEMWALESRMSRQGRNGIRTMRKLLESRLDNQPPAESNNERRFLYLANLAGLTGFERQVNIAAPAWIGRVDFLLADLWLIVEIHSERYHTSWAHRRADAERISRLQAAGYTVVVVWDQELWFEGQAVVNRLTQVRRQLLAG